MAEQLVRDGHGYYCYCNAAATSDSPDVRSPGPSVRSPGPSVRSPGPLGPGNPTHSRYPRPEGPGLRTRLDPDCTTNRRPDQQKRHRRASGETRPLVTKPG
jgi:hypothetical protein